jgi:hypothetical protein
MATVIPYRYIGSTSKRTNNFGFHSTEIPQSLEKLTEFEWTDFSRSSKRVFEFTYLRVLQEHMCKASYELSWLP